MLQVILWGLKLIGILLLVILALVLLILLLVLFLPVRYRFRAEYEDRLNGTGWARWFYPLLEARVEVAENQPSVQVRILGMPWEKLRELRKKRRKKKKRKKRRKNSGGKAAEGQTGETKKTSGKSAGSEKAGQPEPPAEPEKAGQPEPPAGAEPVRQSSAPQGSEAVKTGSGQPEKPRRSLWEKGKEKLTELVQKIKEFIRKIQNYLRNIINNLRTFREKLAGLWGKWETIREILTQEETRKSLILIWGQLKKLLRHLKPKKLELWMHYGTGDPYTLGQHLTALAVVYGLFGEYIEIEPDWEKKVLQARGYVKGRIRIFTLLRICIKVIRDENVKKVWNQISGKERRQTDGRE